MHPVRHPTPSPRSEPFYILWFFSDLVLILTEDFFIFPTMALVFCRCTVCNVICPCDFFSPTFLSKLHPIWMSHSSNCSFSVLQLGILKYASFNTTLEQHILEPQIKAGVLLQPLNFKKCWKDEIIIHYLRWVLRRQETIGLDLKSRDSDWSWELAKCSISQKLGKWGTTETALWETEASYTTASSNRHLLSSRIP